MRNFKYRFTEIAAVVLLIAAVTASGCAKKVATGPRVVMDEIHIIAGADAELGLDTYDAETLMRRGAELFEAGSYKVAAKFFARVLRDYPDTSRAAVAAFNLGLCHELQGDCGAALPYFTLYREKGPADARRDADFRIGSCLMELGRYEDGLAVFKKLLADGGLSDNDRLEVEVSTGVCEYGIGRLDDSETTLYAAIAQYRRISQKEYIENNYFIGEAQFYLGEVERARMDAIALGFPQEKLEKDLEAKARKLLDAQNQYLKVIRIGNIHWAAAAGYRVGGLYETFHRQLLEVPVPPELTEEQGAVYREELRRKVSILLSKAINIYEKTLEMAQRVQLNSKWVDESAVRLEQVRERYMLENLQ